MTEIEFGELIPQKTQSANSFRVFLKLRGYFFLKSLIEAGHGCLHTSSTQEYEAGES